MPQKTGEPNVPLKMRARYDDIVALTNAVSAEHLDAEYAVLAREMAAVLCRKRPSPLANGLAKSWAAAILYALGQINFLFSPESSPHVEARELCRLMGISQNTASTKAAQIRKLLKMRYFDPAWSRRDVVGHSPMAWIVQLSNGLLVDARTLPRELQVQAYERGLIPYLPGQEEE